MADNDRSYKAEHLALFNADKPKHEFNDEAPEVDPKEKMIEQAFSTKDMAMRSELNQKQIYAVLKLELFAEHYESALVGKLSNKFLQLQVSKGRKGRQEFKEMAQSVFYEQQGMGGMPPMGVGSRFLGKE